MIESIRDSKFFTREKRNKTIITLGGVAGAISGYSIPVYKTRACDDIIYNDSVSLKGKLLKEKIILSQKQCKAPNYVLKFLLMILGAFLGAEFTNFLINKSVTKN